MAQSRPLGSQETVADVLRDAIAQEFGTAIELARSVGVSKAQVAHYLRGYASILPKTVEGIAGGLASPVLQHRLFAAYARQVAPPPELPADLPPDAVVAHLNGLFDAGLIEAAISVAERELARAEDYGKWLAIAERLEPLHLRLGHVSDALALRARIEHEAESRNDTQSIISSLAMTETALLSLGSATPAMALRAGERTLAALGRWSPVAPSQKRLRELRLANTARTRSLQILRFVKEKKIGGDALQLAAEEARRALAGDLPEYMVACGLEVEARIKAASGDLFGAEETIDRLESYGLHHGWELWEKSRLTLAELAERRGDPDEALEILRRVRDRCRAVRNEHHARLADQELARLMLEIS